ncbi:MAG: signal peptidase II [Myxococcota bacterium]|jgi:signal peptidase II
MQKRYSIFAAIFGVTLLADQLSKQLVMRNLVEGVDVIHIVDGWLLFEHARNTGGAFSILEGQMLLFGVFTAVAMAVLGHMLWQIEDDQRVLAGSLGMIAGGAIGNGVDRLLYASVTDFVRFYAESGPISELMVRAVGGTAWPTFNVADVALIAGLLASGLGMFLQEDAEELEPEPAAKLIAD